MRGKTVKDQKRGKENRGLLTLLVLNIYIFSLFLPMKTLRIDKGPNIQTTYNFVASGVSY